MEVFDLLSVTKEYSVMSNEIKNRLSDIKDSIVKLEGRIIALDYAIEDSNKTHHQQLHEIKEILKSKKDE